MIASFLLRADHLLRGQTDDAAEFSAREWALAVGFIVVFGCGYGALMGTFSGVLGERMWQIVFSAVKVPLLLLATFGICLPSFFVLNTLAGLRADFSAVLRALVTTQAALTILLVSFAPYTLLWYASFSDYNAAILFNAAVFALASIVAQIVLHRAYRPLISRHPRHRLMMWFWLALYAFVGIQTGWVLRPFIGDPSQPVEFARQHAWSNAYVEVAGKIRSVVVGSSVE